MIRLAGSVFIEIEAAVLSAYPNEACGLLIGRKTGKITIVDEIAPSPNVTTSNKADSFELDPQVRFYTMRRLRGTDQAIIGHFHSHPNGLAQPSARDLAQAYEPELIWVIAGVTANRLQDLRAFRLNKKATGFDEMALQR